MKRDDLGNEADRDGLRRRTTVFLRIITFKPVAPLTQKKKNMEVEVSREARLLFVRLANRRATTLKLKAFSRGGAVFARVFFLAATLLFGATANVGAATYRTPNFIIYADSEAFARKAGEEAEKFRRDLAILWLGGELLNWSNPCAVTIETGPTLGAGGETTFKVEGGEVYDWKITAQGTEERVLDSVLPHEVMHTVLASYLRAQAPRWIDEGMATLTESEFERTNYRFRLADFLHARKGIAFNDMVATTEYPDDVMPFYSQVFSVCEYMVLIGGRRRLVEFAKEGARTNDWNAALRRYYEGRTLGDLQLEWVAWVGDWDAANRPTQLPATPKLRDFDEWRREELLASRGSVPAQTRAAEPTARAQNAEPSESPSKWKETLGDVFDGVRSWGRGPEDAQNSKDLTIRGRKERVETTSASAFEDARTSTPNVRGDRSRQFGETRQVAPSRQNAQTTLNGRNAAKNSSVGESRATILIPRANGTGALNASRTGVLTSGAGSASRSTTF